MRAQRKTQMSHHRIISLAILSFLLVAGWTGDARGRTYTTKFNDTENPISEGGLWINGQTTGINWNDIKTTNHIAKGATGANSLSYDDPTAILTGVWGTNQTVSAIVLVTNRGGYFGEVELRVRSSISAQSITGYEILFSCNDASSAYVQIVRWNGPLGNFTYLASVAGDQYAIHTGDEVKATVVGTTITAYINGTIVAQADDNTFLTGSPGMGFYYQGSGGSIENFGFTSFTATDGLGNPPQPNLSIFSPNSNGTFTIQFDGVPGTTYGIQYAEDITTTNWLPLGTSTASSSGLVQFLDTPTNGAPRRFYRSVWP